MVRSGSRGSAMLDRTGDEGRRPGGASGSPPVDSASAQVEALLLRASSRGVSSNSGESHSRGPGRHRPQGGRSQTRPGPTPATRRAIAKRAGIPPGGLTRDCISGRLRPSTAVHLRPRSARGLGSRTRRAEPGPSVHQRRGGAGAPTWRGRATRRGKWATASPGIGARGIFGRRAARSAPGHRRRRGAMSRVAGPGRRAVLEPSPRSHSLRPPLGKRPAAGSWACPSDRSPAASGPAPDQSS